MLAACVFFYHDSAYYPPRLNEFASRGILDLKVLARYLAVPWVCFVVGYATLIPTTGRRCATVAVIGSIVMLIVPYAIDRIRGPTDPKLFAMFEMDPRTVITDPKALYFGTAVDDRTLTPGDNPRLGPTGFGDWLAESHR